MRIEWDTLQSYTRRIRSILAFQRGVDLESFTTLVNPPADEPLFPNLHTLHCEYTEKTKHLLSLPLPSLVFLKVRFKDPRLLQNSFESFLEFSPNLRTLEAEVGQLVDTFCKIKPNYICRWQYLSCVDCPQIALGLDDLVHLSHIPALSCLAFSPSITLPTLDSPLLFANMRDMTLRSGSLEQISLFLSQTRLPVLVHFATLIESCPSNSGLSLFMAAIQTSNTGRTIERLRLSQFKGHILHSGNPLFCLDDLQPCMAFSSLRHIDLDVGCNVGLRDKDQLTLASAWPHLEKLSINPTFGWGTLGGITPDGFLQLLQMRPSLKSVSLAFDVQGYTEFYQPQGDLGFTIRSLLVIDVLDSPIELKSVSAMASFFARIPCFKLILRAWETTIMRQLRNGGAIYGSKWIAVFRQAIDERL